jgi:KamA family protein
MIPYRALGPRQLEQLGRSAGLSCERIAAMRAVAAVLPFRTNSYVVEQLIDWGAVPDDPIFQLTFPQPGMLREDELMRVGRLLERGDHAQLSLEVAQIRAGLNPHPGGQRSLNVPELDGARLEGMQHKYRETVLFFPAAGQTCHAYCTYCFRWAQFIGDPELRFGAQNTDALVAYLRRHHEVRDVLVTGGDPLIMKTATLSRFIEPLLSPELAHVETIRIGTKALAYWPYRFTDGEDADALLRLFERVIGSGRRLAVMMHSSHPRELLTADVQRAIRLIRDTGASLFCQAPLIRHVNDDAAIWRELWTRQSQLGCIPYYMFVERDTGPRDYFRVSLSEAYDLFRRAYSDLPGLARTVRGPVMSATPGKVVVDGVIQIDGEPYFSLRMLQARDPALVDRPFLARFDDEAAWLDELDLIEGLPDVSNHAPALSLIR